MATRALVLLVAAAILAGCLAADDKGKKHEDLYDAEATKVKLLTSETFNRDVLNSDQVPTPPHPPRRPAPSAPPRVPWIAVGATVR